MSICADFSGGFLQVMSIAAGVNRGNGHSIRSDGRAMVTAEGHLVIVVCHATDPDAGLIVEGAGGGVDQGVLSFGMWPM